MLFLSLPLHLSSGQMLWIKETMVDAVVEVELIVASPVDQVQDAPISHP
jgi:hypothetical protein